MSTLEENLQKQLERVDEARALQDSNLAAYINALMGLVSSYRAVKEESKANETYEEAFVLFTTTSSEEVLRAVRPQPFWNDLAHHRMVLDADLFDEKCKSLFRPSSFSDPTNFPRLLIDATKTCVNRLFGSVKNTAYSRVLYEQARELFGESSERTMPFLLQYATDCDSANEVENAESLYLKASAMMSDQSASAKAQHLLKLSEFYIRHDLFEQGETAFSSAETLCKSGMSESAGRVFAHFLNFYRRSGKASNALPLALRMIALGGQSLLHGIENSLEDMYVKLVTSGFLDKAENLCRKRLEAGELCDYDPGANDWRLRLSELLLASGRDEESNRLFEVLKASIVLQGGVANQIVDRRQGLLDRLEQSKSMKLPSSTKDFDDTSIRRLSTIKIEYGLIASRMQFASHTTIRTSDFRDSPPKPVVDDAICCTSMFSAGRHFRFSGTVFAKASDVGPENRESKSEWASSLPIIPPDKPPSLRPHHELPLPSLPPPPPSDMVPPRPLPPPPPPRTPPPPPPPRPLPPPPAPLRPKSLWEPTVKELSQDVFIPPAFTAPEDAQRIEKPNLVTTLAPGNYTLAGDRLSLNGYLNAVRIFLVDETTSTHFHLSTIGHPGRMRPIDLQIWYSGMKTIRLNRFCGLVYAPNATVELLANSTFTGVIVANKIVGEGNNNIQIDASLLQTVLTA